MAAIIKGTTVILYETSQTGTDAFGAPVFSQTPVEVGNVLIAPVSENEIVDTLSLTGRRAVYRLALPKNDAHNWTDKEVGFFGRRWRVIGDCEEGIDEMIPLDWNRKIRVESVNG